MPPFSGKAERRSRPSRLLALTALVAAALPAGASAARPSAASLMLQELNRVRALHHLGAVRLDRALTRAATGHSRTVARSGVLTHGAWTRRVARAAGGARSVGEVIGSLQTAHPRTEAARLVRSWLASPSHRPLVLGTSFRRAGVGRATGHGFAVYTVDFASAR